MGPSHAQFSFPAAGGPQGEGRLGSPSGCGSAGAGPSSGSPPACVHMHAIRPADTLISIAAQYGIRMQELMQFNRLGSSDIWFRTHLAIPCRDPACRAACGAPEASPAGGPPGAPAAEASEEKERTGDPRASKWLPLQEEQSAAACSETDTKAPHKRPDRGASLPPCQRTPLGGPSRTPGGPPGASQTQEETQRAHSGAPTEDLQTSANLAMLVEGLVRETDIHPRLARQRVLARGLVYAEALKDCEELRRWQRELDLTPPEVLSYLVIYEGDIAKAYSALLEDEKWHREKIRREKLRRDIGSPSSWLCHLKPRLCIRDLHAGYMRLPETAPGAPQPSSSAPRPEVIGRRGTLLTCPNTGMTPLFSSTSIEGIRRRGPRGPRASLDGGPRAATPADTSGGPLGGNTPGEVPIGFSRDGIELQRF